MLGDANYLVSARRIYEDVIFSGRKINTQIVVKSRICHIRASSLQKPISDNVRL